MSSQLVNCPVLCIHNARRLLGDHIVVQGPVYRATWRESLDKHVKAQILIPEGLNTIRDLAVDFSKIYMLSSSEMFGYDPVSTECPHLRRLQNYSTVVLRGLIETMPPSGSFVVPEALTGLCQMEVTLKTSIIRACGNRYLEEFVDASADEMIVFRFDGSREGFVSVSVKDLLTSRSISAQGIMSAGGSSLGSGDVRLLGLFGDAAHAKTLSDLKEVVIGNGNIVSMSYYNG